MNTELQRYREYAKLINPLVCDTVTYLHDALHPESSTATAKISGDSTQVNGDLIYKHLLIEGANAAMLDIDFGTYPFVTSSSCSVGGVSTGLGIPPHAINRVYGVVKAYTTRVGAGPFPTELEDPIGDHLQVRGAEFGTTTLRRRRCGWLDLVVLRHSNMVNGYHALALTKLDVLDELPELKIGIAYRLPDGRRLRSFPASLDVLRDIQVEYVTMPGWQMPTDGVRRFADLPQQAQAYVRFIEADLHVSVRWIGVGKDRRHIIECS